MQCTYERGSVAILIVPALILFLPSNYTPMLAHLKLIATMGRIQGNTLHYFVYLVVQIFLHSLSAFSLVFKILIFPLQFLHEMVLLLSGFIQFFCLLCQLLILRVNRLSQPFNLEQSHVQYNMECLQGGANRNYGLEN